MGKRAVISATKEETVKAFILKDTKNHFNWNTYCW